MQATGSTIFWRSLRTAAPLITVGILWLLGPVAPAAAQSLCVDESPSLYPDVPKQLATGRFWYGYMQSDGGSGFFTDGPITATFQPANPNKRLKHRFSVRLDALKDLPPLRFAPGDSKAQLNVSWTDTLYTGDESCPRALFAVVTPIHGKPPRINVHTSEGGEIVVFKDRSCPGEAAAATGTTTITVHGNGATRRAKLRDQCTTDWHPLYTVAKGWLLTYRFDYESMILRTQPGHLGLGTHRFQFSVRFRHRVLSAGFFDVVVKHSPLYCAIFGC